MQKESNKSYKNNVNIYKANFHKETVFLKSKLNGQILKLHIAGAMKNSKYQYPNILMYEPSVPQ
jgi:hypothetical protein